MRFLELLTTDHRDDAISTRVEWIHRDHIETVQAWPDGRDHRRGWLELTLTSGRTRFVPITVDTDLDHAAAAAVLALLDLDRGPVAAEQ